MTSERHDPTIGALPDIGDDRRGGRVYAASGPQAHGTPQQRSRWPWLLGIVVVLLVLATILYVERDALGKRLVPPPQQTVLMQQADAALRAGRLTATDGHGARELYEAVLARDPDHPAAREGLVHVGAAALAQAQVAARENHPQAARQALELARTLGVQASDLQTVEDALRKHDGGEDRIAALLAQAGAAERAGYRDGGAGSALALYQQALDAAPGNAVVLARRQTLLANLLSGVDPLLANNDVAGAQHLIDRVTAVDPGHLDLPNARAQLSAAVQKQQYARKAALDAADAALRGGHVDAAIDGYRKILAATPDEARARSGLRASAEALVRNAKHAAADFKFDDAKSALAQARAIAPGLPTIVAAEQYMQQVQARRAGFDASASTTNGSARIDDLLAAADHAIMRNQLLDPPGVSAFDKLRAASAIAPADPRVIAATRRFGATATACFQREMTANRLARAEDCLEALIAIEPTHAGLPTMQHTLAARWLDVADERIGAGELDTAQRAIASAQRWTPNDPTIPALKTRLQQARAGGKR